ncbi:MAG TPA: undecaprenyl-phosphate glucose phosphotransferase [Polyangiales bacterium]|nr:undecaprenyl-phosphate glucose phosphotransferase [Polyangiales bacterium]
MEKQTFRLAGTPNGAMRPHEAKLDLLARVADAFWICAALFIACAFYPEVWEVRHSMAAAFGVVLFYMVGQAQGLYRPWRAEPVKSEFSRIWACWAFVIPLLLLVAFMTKTSEAFSRIIIFTWFVLAPALVSVWRVSLRMTLQEARARGYNTRTVAIAGASPLGEELARSIGRSPWMGMKMVGFYDDRHVSRLHPMDPTVGEVKGDLERLVGEAREGLVDVVYIALPMRAEPRINAIIRRLQDTTASVYLAYDFGGFDVLRAQWGQVGNVPVMSVVENPFHGIEGFAKRAEDLVLGSIIMLGIALPMLAIAIAVKLTSRGPVFFRQRRYGLNGEEIRVLKFRSMTVMEDGGEVKQAVKGDQRITKVGAFLRRTSLDELPQFIQVLTGEMSIVGPRPHAVVHNEQYRALIQGYMLRHKVKPGITGWAQVNGWRGETDTLEKMTKRVEYDLAYIRDWELWMDLKIIVMTIFGGFRGKNAY